MQLRVKPRPLTVPAAPTIHGIPALTYARQQEDRWCWAACVEMILKYYCLSQENQCKIATRGLKIKYPDRDFNCCPARGITGACDTGCDHTLDNLEISSLWRDGYGIPVNPVFRPSLPSLEEDLRRLLDQEHPVELGYSGSLSGHLVILFGWHLDPERGETKFHLHDPGRGESAIAVAEGLIDNGGALDAYWVIMKTETERRCGDGNQ